MHQPAPTMIYRTPLAVAFLAGLIAAQNFGIPCGFVCTRRAGYTLFMDGQNTQVQCSSSNGDLASRCNSCCQSYAMWGGLMSTAAAGFPSSDGNSCVCCTSNNRCGGGMPPIQAAARPNNNNGDLF